MSPPKKPEQASKPDVLRELYQQAVADDRGPSAQSSAAILARAKQRVAVASDASAKPSSQAPSQPAANDRFWRRHALGGLAAVGLVGLLMLQHAAWWGGPGTDTGTGIGIGEQPQAEAASAAATDDAASDAVTAEVAAPQAPSVLSLSDENVAFAEASPAADKAVRKAPAIPKFKENQAIAQVDKAPAAMDMEAPSSMAEPSTALPQERSAKMAASAKAPSPNAEPAQPPNLQAQASLPLCPLTDDVPFKNAEAKDGAKKSPIDERALALKTPNCRPRKAHEMRQDKPASAPEAAEGITGPVQ